MASNKNTNSKKIPGAAIALVLVIIAVAVFIPTVYNPYKRKKPEMDRVHQEIVEEIQMYEDSIKNQASIESDIANLEVKWQDFKEEMFVDADASLKDINTKVDEYGFGLTTFKRGTPAQDQSGAVSFTGSPLYYVTLNIAGYTDQETLLKLLNFIEEESVGHYYVKTFSATTVNADKKVSDEIQVKEGDFQINMSVYLYYYVETETTAASTTSTSSTASK